MLKGMMLGALVAVFVAVFVAVPAASAAERLSGGEARRAAYVAFKDTGSAFDGAVRVTSCVRTSPIRVGCRVVLTGADTRCEFRAYVLELPDGYLIRGRRMRCR